MLHNTVLFAFSSLREHSPFLLLASPAQGMSSKYFIFLGVCTPMTVFVRYYFQHHSGFLNLKCCPVHFENLLTDNPAGNFSFFSVIIISSKSIVLLNLQDFGCIITFVGDFQPYFAPTTCIFNAFERKIFCCPPLNISHMTSCIFLLHAI